MFSRRLNTWSLILIMALPVAGSHQSNKPITNQDVIRLVKLGLSADIIITKIDESPAAFDLSIEGLTTLSQNRVPNEVIRAMQSKASGPSSKSRAEKAANGSSAAVPPPTGQPGPRSNATGRNSYPLPPDKGAYLWDGNSMHLLHQTPVTSIGDNVLRRITPFVKKKLELQLVGAHAKAHFDNTQPTILVSGLGDVVPGIPSYRWLFVKTGGMRKDRRIVGTYDVGGFFGSIQMVDNEIACEIKKVSEGIYAITPVRPLPDGEYGLVQVPKLADASAARSFALPVWDFGVYAEGRPSTGDR